MLGLIVVYAAGAATRAVIRPVARGAVKGTAKIGMGIKNLSHEAAAELHGIAAESRAEVGAKEKALPKATVAAPKATVEVPKTTVKASAEPPKPVTSAEAPKPATVIVSAKK